MARARVTQTNFTAGELDPLVAGRVDVEQYSAGAELLRNVVVVPQGGVMRRAGTVYVGRKSGAQSGATRLVPFEFSIDETYVFLFQAATVDIYRDDVLEQSLAHVYNDTTVQEFYYAQSADTLILTHPEIAPLKIVRDTTEAVGSQFSIAALTLENIPNFDFEDDDSPAPINETQRVTFGGGWQAGDEFRLVLDGVRTGRIIYTADSVLLGERVQGALRDLSNTSATGITVDDETDGIDPEGKYLVTFGGTDGGKEWPDLQPRLSDTFSGGITVDEVAVGGSTEESVWSATRGYPACCVFHEDRFWFGGSRSRPATLWGSRTGQYFNFDLGDQLDDDAIEVTLGGQHIQTIYHLGHGRALEVYTESGEWYTPDTPITPGNVAFVKQADVGSKRRSLIPQTVDGASIFVDRAGKGVYQFLYTYAEDAYNAEEISTISQHLIRDPVSICANRETRGNFVYVVNSDGTIACLSLHRKEGVAGWSLFTTDGIFRQVVSVGRVVYATVARVLPGPGIQTTLERFDADCYMDCASVQTAGTATASWSGLEHLELADVEVMGDGLNLGMHVVTSIGTLELDEGDEVEELQVGLAFTPTIRPMPVAPTGHSGSTLQALRRPVRVMLKLYDSAHVTVNGYTVADRLLDRSGTLDNPAPTLSGDYDMRLLGWTRSPKVDISQSCAGPLTLLAVGYNHLEAS